MKRDSMFAMVGMLFGILIGWIVGSQHAGPPAPAGAPASASSGSQASGRATRHRRSTCSASELERTANSQPSNAAVRVELANVL